MVKDPMVIPAHGRHAHAAEFTRDGKVRIWEETGHVSQIPR